MGLARSSYYYQPRGVSSEKRRADADHIGPTSRNAAPRAE